MLCKLVFSESCDRLCELDHIGSFLTDKPSAVCLLKLERFQFTFKIEFK